MNCSAVPRSSAFVGWRWEPDKQYDWEEGRGGAQYGGGQEMGNRKPCPQGGEKWRDQEGTVVELWRLRYERLDDSHTAELLCKAENPITHKWTGRQTPTPTRSCKLRLGMGTVAHVVAAINKPLFVTVVNVMAGWLVLSCNAPPPPPPPPAPHPPPPLSNLYFHEPPQLVRVSSLASLAFTEPWWIYGLINAPLLWAVIPNWTICTATQP